MGGSLTLTIDSDLDLVRVAARALRGACSDIYSEDFIDSLEIALVEAINNIIKHGYSGRRGGDIAIRLDLHVDKALIEIIDQAPPVVPPSAAGSDPFAFDPNDLFSIPEGGMGLALIRANMDELAYLRSTDGNVLRMAKHTSNP